MAKDIKKSKKVNVRIYCSTKVTTPNKFNCDDEINVFLSNYFYILKEFKGIFYQFGNESKNKKFNEKYLFISMYSEESVTISLNVHFGLNETGFLMNTGNFFNKTKEKLKNTKGASVNIDNITDLRKKISKKRIDISNRYFLVEIVLRKKEKMKANLLGFPNKVEENKKIISNEEKEKKFQQKKVFINKILFWLNQNRK